VLLLREMKKQECKNANVILIYSKHGMVMVIVFHVLSAGNNVPDELGGTSFTRNLIINPR